MVSHHYADTGNCRIHYAAAGTRTPQKGIMVFLHGFPEYWQSWQQHMAYFKSDFYVVAPDLPGYNLSDKPTDDAFYKVPNLIAVLAGFIRIVGGGKAVTLVAHDWGGAIAWPLCAFHPELIEKFVILNAAHPSTFTREMLHNPQQQQKSAYIHQMLAPTGAQLLRQDDFAFLRRMLLDGRIQGRFSPEQVDGYIESWAQPGAIESMLRYYRNMPQQPPKHSDASTAKTPGKIPNIVINIPTLVLWGVQDEAFVEEILDGLEDYVPGLTVQRFADASHWLHHEYPDDVNAAINAFVTK